MGSVSAPASMAVLTNSTCMTLYDHKKYPEVLIPILYSVVFIVGLLGNGLALYVIQINLKKMNSTTLYSLNLVVSDILFILSLPVRIIYYAQGFHWTLGEVLCKISSFLFYINTYAGIHFMTCLSVDRFIAVVLPLRFAKFRKVSIVRYICVGVWMWVLVLTVPLLGMKLTNREPQNFTTCMEYPNFEKVDNIASLLISGVLMTFFLPMLIILVCYSFLISKLHYAAKNNRLTDKYGRSRKAIGVICCVSVVFIICYTPYHINVFQYMIRKLVSNPDCADLTAFQVSLHITVCLMNLNACLDPFIYFFACKGYKKKLMKIIKRQASVSFSSAARTSPEGSSKDFIDGHKIQHNGERLTEQKLHEQDQSTVPRQSERAQRISFDMSST